MSDIKSGKGVKLSHLGYGKKEWLHGWCRGLSGYLAAFCCAWSVGGS